MPHEYDCPRPCAECERLKAAYAASTHRLRELVALAETRDDCVPGERLYVEVVLAKAHLARAKGKEGA